MQFLKITIILSIISISCTNLAIADIPFRMQAELSMGGRADNNIYRRTNNISDYIAELHPNLRMMFPFSSRTIGNFQYSYDFEQYRNNQFVNTRNHDISLSIQRKFTNKFSLILRDDIRRSNLPDALDDVNNLIFDYWQNSPRIEGMYRVSKKTLLKGDSEYQRRAYTDRRISRTSNIKQKDSRYNMGLSLIRQLGQRAVGVLAYQYRINSSNADYFDYTNNRVSVLLVRNILLFSPLQVMYRFERRIYPRQVEGTIRRDSRHTVYLSLTTPLTPWLALRGSYAFQLNRSNIRDYKVSLGTMNLMFSWGSVKPNTKPKKNIKSPDATTYYKLGIYYTKKGELDKAVTAFNKSLALNPKDAKAYTNLGFVYIAQKDFKHALVACKRAVELAPNLAEAHTNLGIAHYKMGMQQAAAEEWRTALKIDPANERVRALLQKLSAD
ncbi:MAG: tetratricopeptide repeat protein [Candidatus Poribacteria bacterium]